MHQFRFNIQASQIHSHQTVYPCWDSTSHTLRIHITVSSLVRAISPMIGLASCLCSDGFSAFSPPDRQPRTSFPFGQKPTLVLFARQSRLHDLYGTHRPVSENCQNTLHHVKWPRSLLLHATQTQNRGRDRGYGSSRKEGENSDKYSEGCTCCT